MDTSAADSSHAVAIHVRHDPVAEVTKVVPRVISDGATAVCKLHCPGQPSVDFQNPQHALA